MVDYKDAMWRFVSSSRGTGFLLVDVAGAIAWANDAACTMFGAASGGLAGRAYADLFTDEDRAIGAMETELAIAQSRGFSEDDRWHRRIDGGRFWASGVLSTVCSDDGTVIGYGKVVRNRLDVKEQVVALRSELAACRGFARRQTEASAEAAHELRNTLSGMAALVAMLRHGNVDTEKAAQLADTADRQLGVARRLTEDLMHVATAQRGAPELEIERVALQSILAEAIELVGDLPAERHVAVLAPPLPIVCHTDRGRLMQVLCNLLGNAIKFTRAGGHIWLKLTVEGGTAVIRVEDDGIGIDADMLGRIFEAFTQVEPHAKAGIGMGLAVARETLELLGGSIQASSDGPGTGAVFIVRLPLGR